MKKEFSTAWKGSKQPRKQRKYVAKAPLHIKKKFVSANLSKELRTKYGKRSLPIRKGDTVKIMRGKFRGTKGKVIEVKIKTSKIYVEGIQIKKRDGSKANVRLQPSNLQIVELILDDKKRSQKVTGNKEVKPELKKEETKEKKKQTPKKTNKEVKSGEKK